MIDGLVVRGRGALQRLGRRFPGPLRRAWELLPSPVKNVLRPLVYPIALGLREGPTAYDMRPSPDARPAQPARTGKPAPPVSIVVVTYGNRDLSRLCLESVARATAYPSYEVIAVDNGSPDGTGAMLEDLARSDGRLRVIRNDQNLGFSPASNQGIRAASGEIVVLLNNDTVVSTGWLARLIAPLQDDPAVGLVCAVTNRIPNGAQVPHDYRDLAGMESMAVELAARHGAAVRDLPSVALFCAAVRRAQLVELGMLDERFAVGMFEDDDLSRRLHAAGLRSVCADGCFVHHFGQAAFGKLPDDEYLRIWEENRRRYEEKWGEKWRPPEG